LTTFWPPFNRYGREAYALFREAELLEADGHVAEATAIFRRIGKLSPALAEIYGL
jgi:hypothetical protein